MTTAFVQSLSLPPSPGLRKAMLIGTTRSSVPSTGRLGTSSVPKSGPPKCIKLQENCFTTTMLGTTITPVTEWDPAQANSASVGWMSGSYRPKFSPVACPSSDMPLTFIQAWVRSNATS